MECRDVEAMNEAWLQMLQTFSIILGIISGITGIILFAIRAVKWAQNVDRQIRDLRLGLQGVNNVINALYALMEALYSTFLGLYDRIRRGESLSINDVVSNVITMLGKMSMRVVGEYLQLPLKESESLDPNGEARKRELLRKFQEERITYGEALELRRF
jgi:hypothetical protein